MPWLLLYHDCVIQTLRDSFKQSHQQITTDTPYDDAQVDDRYEYPHVNWAVGRLREAIWRKRTFFWRTHTPGVISFAIHPRFRRDEAVREHAKETPFPQVGIFGSVWHRFSYSPKTLADAHRSWRSPISPSGSCISSLAD